jgi:hypothetical protein
VTTLGALLEHVEVAQGLATRQYASIHNAFERESLLYRVCGQEANAEGAHVYAARMIHAIRFELDDPEPPDVDWEFVHSFMRLD